MTNVNYIACLRSFLVAKSSITSVKLILLTISSSMLINESWFSRCWTMVLWNAWGHHLKQFKIWCNFRSRKSFHPCIFVYKSLNGLRPPDMCHIYNFSSYYHTYNTRSRKDIRRSKAKTNDVNEWKWCNWWRNTESVNSLQLFKKLYKAKYLTSH